MASPSFKTRLLLAFYSTRNIVGCAAALAGVTLFLAGVIQDWWFPIVAGLYAAAWLLVPAGRGQMASTILESANQESLVRAMEDLYAKAKGKLPKEAATRLAHILQRVRELAPGLFSGEVPPAQSMALAATITRDLPQTINHYLKLPPLFASMTVVHDGKTSKQLFIEQLDLLDGQLVKIAESIYRHDADAVVANGKFLQDKFRPMAYTEL